jgi:chromosomal replication initiation ATPase DnaA
LGSSEFVEKFLTDIEAGRGSRRPDDIFPPREFGSMVEKVGERLGLSGGEVLGGSRRRRVVEARNIISYVAVHEYGMSLKKVSEALGISKQSVLRGLEAGAGGLKKEWLRIKDCNP